MSRVSSIGRTGSPRGCGIQPRTLQSISSFPTSSASLSQVLTHHSIQKHTHLHPLICPPPHTHHITNLQTHQTILKPVKQSTHQTPISKPPSKPSLCREPSAPRSTTSTPVHSPTLNLINRKAQCMIPRPSHHRLFSHSPPVHRARALQKNQWPRSPTLYHDNRRQKVEARERNVNILWNNLFARSNEGLGLHIFAREAAREEVSAGRINSCVMRVRF